MADETETVPVAYLSWISFSDSCFMTRMGAIRQFNPVKLFIGVLVSHSKLVLASTKNFYHRLHLSSGILGEVTMHLKNNRYQFFPWPSADYQSKEYQEFFLRIRHIYRAQLRTMCRINKEDEP